MKLDWSHVHRVTAVETLEGLCEKHSSVFQPELGMLKGITAKIHVTKGAAPTFCKPRPVPYALTEAVEKQLVTLESEGFLTPVSGLLQIVCIPKTENTVRILADYKVTIIPWLEVLRTCSQSWHGVRSSQSWIFHQAYQQVQLAPSTISPLICIRGCLRSRGVLMVSPVDQILQGIDGVICYIDDILITVCDTVEHMINLDVLKRLKVQSRLKERNCISSRTA